MNPSEHSQSSGGDDPTLSPKRREELDDRWIEASLNEMYQPNEKSSDAKLQELMGRIRGSETDGSQPRPGTVELAKKSQSVSFRTFAGMLVSVAAVVLVAMFFWPPGGSDRPASPQALMQLCSTAWQNHSVRHYQLKAERNGRDSIEADLWVNSESRFVLRHQRKNGRILMIGGDRNSRWIVPERGPVLIGKPGLMARWLQSKDADADYLKIERLLGRIPEFYRLEPFVDDTVSVAWADEKLSAYRFSAMAIERSSKIFPIQIDALVDASSSEIIQLDLDWKDDGPLKLKSVSFRLLGYPEREDSWFDWENHADPNQRVIDRYRLDESEST